MDAQDHKKIHPPGLFFAVFALMGSLPLMKSFDLYLTLALFSCFPVCWNEGHEVHVCHNCGWPFPNPHPSAKHRRAHKKLCGTIEGYKLDGSADTTHLAVSDGDQHSDEDPKTPSPKILERSDNEKASGVGGGLGERSSRSEEELFSDAPTEFIDTGGSSPGTEETLKDIKEPGISVDTVSDNCVTITQPNDDGLASGVTSAPSVNSADSSEIQATEVRESYLSVGSPESERNILNSGLNPMALADGKTGESVTDPNPIKLDAQADALLENKDKSASKNLQDNDGKEDEGNNIDRKTDIVALPVVNASETSVLLPELGKSDDATPDPVPVDEVVALAAVNASETSVILSELGKSNDTTPNPVPVDGIGQSKEGDNGGLVSSYDLSAETKSAEKMNASIDSAQISLGVPQVLDVDGSGNAAEVHYRNEGQETMLVLSAPDQLPAVGDTDIMIKGFKDHEDVDGSGNAAKVHYRYKEGKETMHVLSAPDELPAADDADNMIKGFKDHEGGKLSGFVNADSFEIVHEVQDSVSENNSYSSLKSLEEGDVLSESGTHVFHDNLGRQGENNEIVFEECPGGGESTAFQSGKTVNADQISEESGASVNNGVLDLEKRHNAQSPQHATTVVSDADHVVIPTEFEVWQTTNFVSKDDAGVDISGNADRKDESATGLTDGNQLNKSKTSIEYASNTHVSSENALGVSDYTSPSPEPTENALGASEYKFPEPEYTNSAIMTGTQEGVKELESCDNDKVQIEHVAGDSTAAQSNNGAIELIQNPPHDEMSSKPIISPSDSSSFIHNSATAEDDHQKDFVGNGSESLLNESDQNPVTPQLVSAADLAVDSSSQTDSVEGHWGSVSVLSTQSDIPAFADSGPLPATGSQATSEEADKSSLHKPKSPSVMQHPDKSDLFEPPSFMTLVEPRAVSAQNPTAASEIQTLQNAQQGTALQAGWFPSINHPVNESQGRKKNEEIIAKVTNWSAGKQHVPLKNLLGEASSQTKPKSSNLLENSAPVVHKDPSPANDNGGLPATVSSVPGRQAPIVEPANAKREGQEEWNSPARYPAEVTREKRKVKGRPYWAQFVCCSSVN
ncbi:hypothetical protein Tsubulata_038342 [Turnera subulata]|uniref:C2H2-type domain-containing protein n=1 Tax=Turnera subulata TaxID=218843 RepID=A0A9Q0GBZ0_9ROSI|nr:hypothetical protein Tsubulata_038342 [Turnera subulata]